MRTLLVLAIHLVTSIAKLLGPGGARGLLAETLLVKHQLLVIDRARHRAPNLTSSDRVLMGLCSLFMTPDRIRKAAAALSPVTLFKFHEALKKRKYRLLFSGERKGKPGPKGPSRALIEVIVEMKRRNPRYGCRRIAQQLAKAFGIDIDKDVVRRVLAKHYRLGPDTGGGPSWLTFIGHMKDSLWRRTGSSNGLESISVPLQRPRNRRDPHPSLSAIRRAQTADRSADEKDELL